MVDSFTGSFLAKLVYQGIQTSEVVKILSKQLLEAESEEEREEVLDRIQDEDIRQAVYTAYQRGYQEGVEEVDQALNDVEPRPEIDQEIEDFFNRRLDTSIEDDTQQEIAAKIRSIFEEYENVTITEIQKAFEDNLEDKMDEMMEETAGIKSDLEDMKRSRRIWQAVSILLGCLSVALGLVASSIPLPF